MKRERFKESVEVVMDKADKPTTARKTTGETYMGGYPVAGSVECTVHAS